MKTNSAATLFASCALAFASVAVAQLPPDLPAAPLPDNRVAAGTRIEISIDEAINSQTHKTGDMFAISLAQPVVLAGTALIAAGTKGQGQIVHASKRGWGGRAGELVLAARYLDMGTRRIALRGMMLGGVGKSKTGEAILAGALATPLSFVVTGTSAIIAPGQLATAKLAEDVVVPPVDAVPASKNLPTEGKTQ